MSGRIIVPGDGQFQQRKAAPLPAWDQQKIERRLYEGLMDFLYFHFTKGYGNEHIRRVAMKEGRGDLPAVFLDMQRKQFKEYERLMPEKMRRVRERVLQRLGRKYLGK